MSLARSKGVHNVKTKAGPHKERMAILFDRLTFERVRPFRGNRVSSILPFVRRTGSSSTMHPPTTPR
jgi:hypothetical protein